MPMIPHLATGAAASAPAATASPTASLAQILQPGATIEAKILAARADSVRIAVNGLMLDALTDLPLQPGSMLKLAVSQAGQGIRLTIVEQTLPDAPAARTAQLPPAAAAQASALAQAARAAAPVQTGLAPLFANLPLIVAARSVPADIREAAAQLLAARPALDETLTADDLRQAFKTSGVLLEASIANAAAPPRSDLKAALIILRQLLADGTKISGDAGTAGDAADHAALTPARGGAQPASAGLPGNGSAKTPEGFPRNAGAPVATPSSVPSSPALDPAAGAPPRPQLASLLGAQASEQATLASVLTRGSAVTTGAPASANLPVDPPSNMRQAQAAATPAPPLRGGLPAAQAIVPSGLDANAPAAQMAAKLLDQVDGALARQTLLQVASLPEASDAAALNQTQQRWAFEIPFATPQGTAIAQFEISDDGGGAASLSADKRVWRARFTLDVEPAGPVHALVSLTGEKANVRIWAERPETAAQLREQSPALDSALRQAALEPGDIVVQNGAPLNPQPARAGHFLDRAT